MTRENVPQASPNDLHRHQQVNYNDDEEVSSRKKRSDRSRISKSIQSDGVHQREKHQTETNRIAEVSLEGITDRCMMGCFVEIVKRDDDEVRDDAGLIRI